MAYSFGIFNAVSLIEPVCVMLRVLPDSVMSEENKVQRRHYCGWGKARHFWSLLTKLGCGSDFSFSNLGFIDFLLFSGQPAEPMHTTRSQLLYLLLAEGMPLKEFHS